MRVAWFIPRPADAAHPIDDTPSLVAELGTGHQVDLYDERAAYDFVWRHWRQRYDVCVYELTDSPAAAFLWPYLIHYPGIVRLRSPSVRRSRGNMLRGTGRLRDYQAEAAIGGRDGLGIPLAASPLTVVADTYAARRLEDAHAGARLRHAPLGIPADIGQAAPPREVPVFGVVETTGADVAMRAAERARAAGTSLDLRLDIADASALSACDVIVSLHWPPAPEPPLGALFAMAAGRPAIVYESAVTAAWPAIEPQAWQARGFNAEREPVVVSIDLRDAEHSLMGAMQRLAADATLRGRLGGAARTWWHANATPAHAAAAWDALLHEAAVITPPPLPEHWPAHLTADGTERAREMLGQFGVEVDLFPEVHGGHSVHGDDFTQGLRRTETR